MKTSVCIFVLSLIVATYAHQLMAQTLPDVVIEEKPKTTEQFVTLRNQKAITPEGGVAMFIVALKLYKDTPELGEKCLVIAVDKKQLVKGDVYKGYEMWNTKRKQLQRQLKRYPFLPESYIKGSSPENGYSVKLPFVVQCSVNKYCGDKSTGMYKVFVKCSGADSPRPVHVKRNDKGYWKVTNWSSIITGIKPVVEDNTDDL